MQEKISAEYADFRKKHWTDSWNEIDVDKSWTVETQRELIALKELGAAALDDKDFKEVNYSFANVNHMISGIVKNKSSISC